MSNQILHNAGAHSSIPTGATRVPATTGATPTDAAAHNGAPAMRDVCKCTHVQLDHLGALCNHLEEASACFAAPPDGVYSDDLRRRNLSPEGEHKLPSPCSVSWGSNPNPGADAYQWNIHFLLEDFMEVIEGLFADGRLNAIRSKDLALGAYGAPYSFDEVYLAGEFDIEMHSYDDGRCYYELSYTPDTMSSIRMFALVEQEELGNIRAELARYGVQLPEEDIC